MTWIACGPCLLQCPQGMERASAFCGLVGLDDDVSVQVQLLPAPLAEVRPGMRADKLESRGMFLLGQERTAIAGSEGLLLHVAQPRGDETFLKWIGITGNERNTILITAAFPQPVSNWSTALRNVVLSARLSDDDSVAADPPFCTLTAEPPFAPTGQFEGQVIYTRGGVLPLPRPTDPLFLVARGAAAVAPDQRAEYAAQRGRLLEGAQEVEFESTVPISIDCLDGVQMSGQTQPGPGCMFVSQTTLFDKSEYYLLVGMCRANERPDFEPLFRRMAASFERFRSHETH